MADNYSTEANAGFRFTAATFNAGAAWLGHVRANIEKVIDREVIAADGNNYPVSRPINTLDARITVECLDQVAGLAETSAAANCVLSYTEAGGTSGVSVTVGAMRAGSIRHQWNRSMGGFGLAQDMELEGPLTYTVTN